jgi:hypothetical protein
MLPPKVPSDFTPMDTDLPPTLAWMTSLQFLDDNHQTITVLPAPRGGTLRSRGGTVRTTHCRVASTDAPWRLYTKHKSHCAVITPQ